jgi:hypothetical protein
MVQRSTARGGLPPNEGAAEAIFALLAAWRVEVCLLAPPVALGVWTYLHFGPVWAGLVVTFVVLLMVVPAPNRHLLGRALHAANVRRRLEMAFRSLPGVLSNRPPYVAKIVRTNVGRPGGAGTTPWDIHRGTATGRADHCGIARRAGGAPGGGPGSPRPRHLVDHTA